MTCKKCGNEIGAPNFYHVRTVELRDTVLESTPDGTGRVVHLDSGAFCSTGCLAHYLNDKLTQEHP